jgi:hypothetical protein
MARGGSPIPKGLRPLIGGAVLVASVRVIDVAWRRITGRPTPSTSDTDVDADALDAGAPSVVRDRLLYALLLGGAERLARRSGLPKPKQRDRSQPDGPAQNGKSPA